ncbi:peroxiredoxin family protein [Persicitalea sp.]|uniref:peroxiredoxin family protein n=1 Tax=Persicitalea sp. TaxID=3100273 RepID=UPI00359404BD
MKKLSFWIFALVGLSLAACDSPSTTTIKNGTWRATLLRDGHTLPFLLDIETNSDGQTYSAYALNGTERFKMDTAYVENDSLHIPVELYDSELIGKIGEDKLTGVWRESRPGQPVGELPFEAVYGQAYRFFEQGIIASGVSVGGKWAVKFVTENPADSYEAVGIFEQKGSELTGTFLTPTGDYRYLAGNVKGDSMYLSCFDGTHVFLFTAALQSDGTLSGEAFYGLTSYETWTARPDANAKLPDANTLTFIKPGYDSFDFKFPNADGNMVSLQDAAFKNKVVVVQIMGSWCPNCMDETRFLAPWYKKNRDRGVEIVGLAFERSGKLEDSAPKLRKMAQRYDVYYPMLLAGTSDKDSAAASLPMLNHVMSFPTTIVLDKKHNVRNIHTGFSGPGTGKYYDEFVADFNRLVDKLVQE